MKRQRATAETVGIADVYRSVEERLSHTEAEAEQADAAAQQCAEEARAHRREAKRLTREADDAALAAEKHAKNRDRLRGEVAALKKAQAALGDYAKTAAQQFTLSNIVDDVAYGAKEGTQRRVVLSMLQHADGKTVTYAEVEAELRERGFELSSNRRLRRRALYDLFYRLFKIDERLGREWVVADGEDGWVWLGPRIVS